MVLECVGSTSPSNMAPFTRNTPQMAHSPPNQHKGTRAHIWRAHTRAPKSPRHQNLAELHFKPTSTHHTEVAVTNPRPSCTTRIREHQCDTIGWLSARAHATQYARHHHQCFRKKKPEIRRADHAQRFIVCAFKPRHRSLVRSTRPVPPPFERWWFGGFHPNLTLFTHPHRENCGQTWCT